MSRRPAPGPDEDVLGRAYDARLIRRLWAYARPYRGALAASAALFPLAAGAALLPPYLVKVAIDDHILTGDRAGLARVSLVYLAVLAAQYVLGYAQLYLLSWTGQRVVHDLRAALFAHVQRLPARFFDHNPVGRLMTRVLGDGEAIGEMFTAGIVSIVGDVVTLTGVVIVMLVLNTQLALASFAAVPVLVGVALYFRPRARAAYRNVRNRLARLSGFLQESLQGMTVIQLFSRQNAEGAKFGDLNREYREAVFHRMRYDALLYAIVEVIGSVAVAGILWWAAGGILSGTVTFGVLVAFMEYTHRFFLPIRDLSAKYTVMQAAMVAAERIFALLDAPPEAPARPPAPDPRPGAAPAVEFQNVSFSYRYGSSPDAPPVLSEVSFRIPRGQKVAVVGPTGAGKTTLARLLIRAYDVTEGAVLVDGVDVRAWDLRELRRHVGLVLQDVVVFSGTVEENLTLGGQASREVVERAARRAHVEPFVRALPAGYKEELRERGANLSHGQRQLLSVARALVYDPPVLVLDEATSSVDPETERFLQDAIDQLLEGRTSIVIAHRFSTIKEVDRVLVLQHGRLLEDGSPAELLARGGLYAALWELQQGTGAAAEDSTRAGAP